MKVMHEGRLEGIRGRDRGRASLVIDLKGRLDRK